jgi:hypothetical protein
VDPHAIDARRIDAERRQQLRECGPARREVDEVTRAGDLARPGQRAQPGRDQLRVLVGQQYAVVGPPRQEDRRAHAAEGLGAEEDADRRHHERGADPTIDGRLDRGELAA